MAKKETPTNPNDKIKGALDKLSELAADLAEKGELPGIGQVNLTAAASSPGYAEWAAQAKFKATQSDQVFEQGIPVEVVPRQKRVGGRPIKKPPGALGAKLRGDGLENPF